MAVSKEYAMQIGISCAMLLDAIDRLEAMVREPSGFIDDDFAAARRTSIEVWITDAREIVLVIKSFL